MQAWKKRSEHTLCVTKLYAQLPKGGGPCLDFAYFSMQFYSPGDPKGGGGHGTMAPPPKHAPGGMNLDHDFFQVSKLSEDQKMEHFFSPTSGEDQKKKVFIKNGTLFFPGFRSRPALRCTPESNYWGGMLMKTILKLLGGYPPRVSAPLSNEQLFVLQIY